PAQIFDYGWLWFCAVLTEVILNSPARVTVSFLHPFIFLFLSFCLAYLWSFDFHKVPVNEDLSTVQVVSEYDNNSYLASVGSTAHDGEHRHSLSEHIYQSYACTFLNDGTAYRCCSTSPSRGSLFTCRRSPRLLSNGYYILTEDSFLSDEDGNITLSPSQTSVTYKENLVRIFRQRKKMRRSLASLFSLSASSQWLSSTILNTMDSSHVDDPWPDKCSELQASQTDTESNSVPNFLAQIAALMVCLIISVCTRYFLGGLSAILFLIILVFLVSQDAALSSFFSFVTSFKTTKFGIIEKKE
uniref:Transmembrane protein 71 n=1 Tax=Meleagris gallopavo TaxID=9103 RepID=G1NJL1_MELGA